MARKQSGFERTFEANLKTRKIKFEFEKLKLPYTLEREYWPDYTFPDQPFIIETKGLLDRESKAKMLAVKRRYPELDIRFVFMNADKKIPGTRQTHGEWATKNGFIWANGTAPEEWFE